MSAESKDPQSSPCVRNCCLDENDVCLGCFRTVTEIVSWSGLTEEQRKRVLHACTLRQSGHSAPVFPPFKS